MNAELMRACYALGHGVDFATGREMVIRQAADLTADGLAMMCRAWKADRDEVLAGIAYQRGIEQAAARMIAAGMMKEER